MEEEVTIKPLSKSNLKESLKLLDRVFGDDPDDKLMYNRGFKTSLGSKDYLHMYEGGRPKYLKYFVAIDKKSGKIIGTTGLYAFSKDFEDNAFSTGWFCVDPDYRSKGIGKLLLEFTIKRAKKLKGKYLRLWTSDTPGTEIARKFYAKRGFIVTSKKKGKSYTRIDMELKI